MGQNRDSKSSVATQQVMWDDLYPRGIGMWETWLNRRDGHEPIENYVSCSSSGLLPCSPPTDPARLSGNPTNRTTMAPIVSIEKERFIWPEIEIPEVRPSVPINRSITIMTPIREEKMPRSAPVALSPSFSDARSGPAKIARKPNTNARIVSAQRPRN